MANDIHPPWPRLSHVHLPILRGFIYFLSIFNCIIYSFLQCHLMYKGFSALRHNDIVPRANIKQWASISSSRAGDFNSDLTCLKSQPLAAFMHLQQLYANSFRRAESLGASAQGYRCHTACCPSLFTVRRCPHRVPLNLGL
jgi:hypothetical protein